LAGTVWLHGDDGVEPARSGSLVVSSGLNTTTITLDGDGRYQLSVADGAELTLMAEPYQPCVVLVEARADTTIDVHAVSSPAQLGANLPQALPASVPILSGVVYEYTPDGRVPVPGARVSLDVLGWDTTAATTLTDSDGRYVLCAVPRRTLMTIFASATGFQTFQLSGDLIGRTSMDIALRRQ
jgi:hypothetical protein